jgi:hypothetical protein
MKKLLVASLALGLMIAPAFAESQVAPINAGSLGVVDIPVSTAKSITLDIEDARFASRSVGRLTLEARGINFRNGVLETLRANMLNGNFDNNIKVDEFIINTSAFSFDTFELLNHQRFVLDKPITAAIQLRISEDNLNNFFTHPKTIEKLEKAIQKKTGGLKLISFSNPSLELLGGDKVKLNTLIVIGDAVGAPLEMIGKMKVKNNKLVFSDLDVTSSDTRLPVDVASVFQSQLNSLIDLEKLGESHFTVQAKNLKISKKMVEIDGNAAMTRLEFGKN